MQTTMTDFDRLKLKLLQFRDERDWAQFHNSKDLAIAIAVEAGELLEQFLWSNPTDLTNSPHDEDQLRRVRHELADILIFSIYLAEKLSIDLIAAAHEKIDLNEEKYPIQKSSGTSRKYTEI